MKMEVKKIGFIYLRKPGTKDRYNIIVIRNKKSHNLAKKRDQLIDTLDDMYKKNKWAKFNDGEHFDISLEVTKIEQELAKTCEVLDTDQSEMIYNLMFEMEGKK